MDKLFFIIIVISVVSFTTCRKIPTIADNPNDPNSSNYVLPKATEFNVQKNLTNNTLNASWKLNHNNPITGYLIYSSPVNHESQFVLDTIVDSTSINSDSLFVIYLSNPVSFYSYYKIITYKVTLSDTIFSEAAYDSISQHAFNFNKESFGDSTQIRWFNNFIFNVDIEIQKTTSLNTYETVYSGALNTNSTKPSDINFRYDLFYISNQDSLENSSWRFRVLSEIESTPFLKSILSRAIASKIMETILFFPLK